MAATATPTEPKPTSAKREQQLFSTSFDANGRQRIKLAKPVAQNILKTRSYISLLSKGCPIIQEQANKAIDALNDLTKALAILGGLDSMIPKDETPKA